MHYRISQTKFHHLVINTRIFVVRSRCTHNYPIVSEQRSRATPLSNPGSIQLFRRIPIATRFYHLTYSNLYFVSRPFIRDDECTCLQKRNMLHETKNRMRIRDKSRWRMSLISFLNFPPLRPKRAMQCSSKTVSKNASLPGPIYIQM